MKNLYLICISLLFLSFTSEAQETGFFEITVTDLPGGTTNRAVVKMRAVNNVLPIISTCDPGEEFYQTDIVEGMTFGLKWPASSPITNVTVTSTNNTQGACPVEESVLGGYGIAAGSVTITEGALRVKAFLANTTPTPTQTDWALNEWITICTLTLVGGNCTVCEDLDIYLLGDAPVAEGESTFDPIFAFNETGSDPRVFQIQPNNAPLPLNLVSFQAEKYETQDALLSWTTANEENTSHFQIQRSFDKKNWYDAGSISAAGYSIDIRNYTFMDYKVYNGRDARLPVYYRLNMVDLDGRSKLSPIQTVIFGNNSVASNSFSVYPNPSTDGVQVEWDANNIDQPTLLEIYDITGKLVLQQKVSENANQEYIDFGPAKITSGLYLLRILNGTEPIDHKQIVVGQSR